MYRVPRNTFVIVCILLLATAFGVHAAVPYHAATPRETLTTFLTATDDGVRDFNTASRLLQNTGVPPGAQVQIAQHLREIMRGRGLYVRLDAVPDKADYTDASTQRKEYRPFPKEPRIAIVRDGDVWVFSAYTVQTVPEMYDALYPFGLEILAGLTPQDGARFLGLFLWQWISMAVMIVLALIGVRLLQPLAAWFVRWSFRRLHLSEPDKAVFRHIGRSLALFVVSIVVAFVLPLLRLPLEMSRHAVLIVNVLSAAFAVITAYRLVDAIVEHIAWKTSQGRHAHSALRPLLRRALKLVVVTFGIVIILQQFDVNITAIIAGLSIGGVAVALASQDTIRNLLGALMIMTDKPFVPGDHIIVQGAEGVVEDIGLRSTRLRSATNSIVYIPNGRLADMTIDNLGLRVMNQYKVTLNLAYQTTPEQLHRFIDGLRAIVMEHPHTIKDTGATTISFAEYGDFSLKVLFQCFFTPTTADETQDRMEINLAIQRLASEVGVSFAVPTHAVIQTGSFT